MTEYALIAVLVCLGIAAIITATGPAIGNIFSNTVYNLLGQKFTPNPTLSAADISQYATDIASITPPPPTYLTNTPLVPTCASGSNINKWAFTLVPNPPGSSNGLGTWVPGEPSYSCP
jgi:Flp pilus assembly pilin Flp